MGDPVEKITKPSAVIREILRDMDPHEAMLAIFHNTAEIARNAGIPDEELNQVAINEATFKAVVAEARKLNSL